VRRDGKLRGPVTMWAVRHGDGIYVRSVSGRGSSWFRGAADSHQAHVRAGGIERDVSLVEIDELNDEIDAAYSRDFKILGVCVSSLAFSFQRGTSLSVAARASLPTITGPATSGPAEPPPPRLRGTRGRHPTSMPDRRCRRCRNRRRRVFAFRSDPYVSRPGLEPSRTLLAG
jgi:hypothetical protein